MGLDYAQDSKININELDIEWLAHPDMERKYIMQVSRYRRKVIKMVETEKLAHEKVKNTRSKLVQNCHENPERCIGKSKATGPEAEAYYRTHPDYLIAKRKWIKVQTRLLKAEEDHETCVSMKDLMHFTKTKAMEELVKLHGQSYFAGPDVPRDLNREIRKKEKMEEKLRTRSKKIGKKMVRRNRS